MFECYFDTEKTIGWLIHERESTLRKQSQQGFTICPYLAFAAEGVGDQIIDCIVVFNWCCARIVSFSIALFLTLFCQTVLWSNGSSMFLWPWPWKSFRTWEISKKGIMGNLREDWRMMIGGKGVHSRQNQKLQKANCDWNISLNKLPIRLLWNMPSQHPHFSFSSLVS